MTVPQKWEYRVLPLMSLGVSAEKERSLNASGAEAWELVAVTETERYAPVAYLKRPKQ